MAHSRTVIRATAGNARGPSAALTRANSLIVAESQGELFLTAFCAMLDTDSGRLVYANAGHNRPLWLQAGADQFQIAGAGQCGGDTAAARRRGSALPFVRHAKDKSP